MHVVVSLEGALGKITSHTVRNPRQLLQVSDRKASTQSAQDSPELSSGDNAPKVCNKHIGICVAGDNRVLMNFFVTTRCQPLHARLSMTERRSYA